MFGKDLCTIYYFDVFLDRELDQDLFQYLQSFFKMPHPKINVEKYKEMNPNWKEDTFFGCTGSNGEFILTNRKYSYSQLYNNKLTSGDPIGNLLTIYSYFTISDIHKRNLKLINDQKYYRDIITWLLFFIENFLETAPEPYFLNGQIRIKTNSKREFIRIKNNIITTERIP